MSKFNPLCTIVVTVIEGRYFPQNSNGKLYIECRFTDEVLSTISPDSNSILSTDSVEQISFPIWDTELAWEVDQKTLHILRSQWAHLKLQCFSIDSTKGDGNNNRGELIGYSMLDLRIASEKSGKERWISLINTNVKGGLLPEVKISFCILPNLSPPTTPSVSSNNNSGYIPSPLGKSSLSSEEIELYKIGNNGTEIFLFSITINFGVNLHLLLQDTISFLTQQQFPELDLSTLNHGYYFQYTMFKSVITSNKFYDLSHPNFNPETFTFRIQSSLEELKSFLIKESKVIINLYHDNQIIGFAEIPLTGLFDFKTGEPRSLDRVCPMYNSKRELPVSADVQTARIGIYLTIKRENSENYSVTGTSSDAVERAKSFLIENVQENEQQQIREQNSEHKYRVLIDLESIQLNKNIKNIYIRYSYPALGITNSKSTQILSNVEEYKDVLLVNGTNTIDVRMTPQRLNRYFEAVPLLMEIWQSVDQKQSQIGVATLRLEEVFLSQPVIDEETNAEIKTFTTLAPIKVIGVSTNSREMGHISVSIRLDDYGESNSIQQQKGLTKSQSATELSELFKELQPAKEEKDKEKDDDTAKSLEENENENSFINNDEHISTFRSDLFKKAAERMKFTQETLAVKKKNVTRQSFSKFKIQQLKSLDRQLQQYILSFKTRDESLLRSEKDFERRWLELDRQFDQKAKELENRNSSVVNGDLVKNLQQEINDLKVRLDTTKHEKDNYESQWLRSLQVLAGMHESESEEALFWKGFREMDQCWWQVKRMAEEEMELIDYEKFTLDVLKGEIERLKSHSQSR